jgi:hypothetical protein
VNNAQVLDPALEVSLVGLSLKIARGPVKAHWLDSNAAVLNTITLAPEVPKGIRKMRRALRDELGKFSIGRRIKFDVCLRQSLRRKITSMARGCAARHCCATSAI